MIDPKLLRENPDAIRTSLRRRGLKMDLDAVIRLEADVRSNRQEAETLRAEQNEAGREIASLTGSEKEAAISAVSDLAAKVKTANARVDELVDELDKKLLQLPNLVAADAADGFTEDDNIELRRVGDNSSEGADHASLGSRLGIIDTDRGAKVSGSRFGYLLGKGALLEFALVRWAMDHLGEAGFTPMVPPVLVREHALEGTGFFPEAREQVYEVPKDELFLVGTSEVPMAAYHGDEILEPERPAGLIFMGGNRWWLIG